MTKNLCAHPTQLLNPTISKFRHSSYMVIITLYSSKILLPLHCFLTLQFQTFTNLLIGIFWGLGIPPFFFEIGTHYASIIVNIITKTPLTHSVHWGLTLHPLKHHPFLFAKPPLKSANYPSHPVQVIHPQKFFFSCTYIKIEFFSELL